MTAKQFDKQKEIIYSKYGVEKSNRSHEVVLESSFGKLYISSEHLPRIKVANLHSRLEGDAHKFKDVLGYDINTYNGKCNFYSDDPQYILDTLDEYLNNIKYFENNLPN